ncbi:hypothetical protein Tco_0138652 [Tanacetum coccineum]
MVPRTVLTRSGPILVNVVRPVNTVQSRTGVNNAGPMKNVINNAYSTARRPFNKITTANNSNFTKKVNTVKGTRVNTARPKAVLSAIKGNKGNAVKALACWGWRLKHKVLDHGNPQQDLKDKGVIDSGCSRHITRNRSYLIDYEEIDEGFVAFGGNSKGGKIIGKGKIRTGKLDFKDVYFVKELKFNLFSVSQMCDKKNSVLFTNTEYVVLSPDFKLIEKCQERIACIENLIDLKVKVIRCDNRTEFKNRARNQFCEIMGRKHVLSFMRPFGCPVTILNTIDHLGIKACNDADSKSSSDAGFKPSGEEEKKDAKDPGNEGSEVPSIEEPRVYQVKDDNVSSTNNVNTTSSLPLSLVPTVNTLDALLLVEYPTKNLSSAFSSNLPSELWVLRL